MSTLYSRPEDSLQIPYEKIWAWSGSSTTDGELTPAEKCRQKGHCITGEGCQNRVGGIEFRGLGFRLRLSPLMFVADWDILLKNSMKRFLHVSGVVNLNSRLSTQ